MCTIGKVQGKAALAVAASHRKLGLRAVCVYQHQPVTGYDIGIHHHVQVISTSEMPSLPIRATVIIRSPFASVPWKTVRPEKLV